MSDLDQYRTLYVAEAREYHENIVKNLLILENGPDQKAIAEIFRSAHSLKGMSASMEFKDMEHLCHIMEDVFSLIRNGELFVHQSLMDVLLETTDAIEHMIDDIEAGDKGLDPDLEYHVQSLQEWITNGETTHDSDNLNPDLSPMQDTIVSQEQEIVTSETDLIVDEGKDRYIVHIELTPECDNKNLRGMLILQNLNEFGQIISIRPEQNVIEDGIFSGVMDLEIASDSDPEALKTVLKGTDVALITVMTLEEAKESPNILTATEYNAVPGKIEKKAEESEVLKKPQERQEKLREVKNIRVDITRLDQMMNLIEDLVINRGRLTQIARKHKIKEMDETLSMVGRSVSELQNLMMNIRMIPLNQIFSRFPRTIRDLAHKQGKDIEFTIEGGETELDRSVMDGLNDPLLHLIRNAIDHGIEVPDERERRGKPGKGHLKLSAERDRDNVVIIIEDDGAGINIERVRNKAIERGLISSESASEMPKEAVIDLLFLPGFSTAEKITDVSGRGVGLDVVRTAIESLKGQIKVDTEMGAGTRFELLLPPTMAIVNVMMVRFNGKRAAIPVNNIVEVASLVANNIHRVIDSEAIVLRDEVLTLHRMDDMFGHCENSEVLLVLHDQNNKGVIVADLIEGQQEVVIKPLSKFIGICKGVSGVTIPGDGEVVPVLDVHSIIKTQGSKHQKTNTEKTGRKTTQTEANNMVVIGAVQIDALKELGNIGASHAATTLSTMLGTNITITVPEINIVDIKDLHNHLDNSLAAMVLFQISGQVENGGYLLLHVPKNSIFRLTNVMLGLTDTEREITEMDQSALLEVGNIMMSAFLDAVATLLNIVMLPSPPQLTIDIPIAAVETIIASNAGEEDIDEVVLFKTELLSSEHEIDCNILLLPNHPMLGQLIKMLEDLMKPS